VNHQKLPLNRKYTFKFGVETAVVAPELGYHFVSEIVIPGDFGMCTHIPIYFAQLPSWHFIFIYLLRVRDICSLFIKLFNDRL